MHTSFTTILSRFKQLSALVSAEENEISRETTDRTGITLGTPKADEYLQEPRACEEALRAFLGALPVSYVFSLTALMYAGRDGREDPVDYWSHLKDSFKSRDEAVMAIMEKSPRVEYMERGLTKLAKTNIDDIPGRITKV